MRLLQEMKLEEYKDYSIRKTRLFRRQQDMETEKKKKGLLSTIWESMTKTGGCCGPGESCCGPADDDSKNSSANKDTKESGDGE